MKKSILLFSFLISLAASSFAQVFTVGTGTTNNLYGPIYIFSSGSTNTHSWNLSIYEQSELTTSGAGAGTINSIGWYKNDAGAYLGNDATFEIFIKPTTLIDFAGGAGNFDLESVGATLVYSNNSVGLPASIGWVDFPLTVPYSWNGTDNLMILTRWVRVGAGTGAVNWASTAGFSPAKVSHSFSASSSMGSLYTTGSRANIHFSITPLGLSEMDASASLSLFPNPAKDQLTLSQVGEKEFGQVQIFDSFGQLVYTENRTQRNTSIDLSSFAAGIYTLQLKTPNTFAVKKFVKTE